METTDLHEREEKKNLAILGQEAEVAYQMRNLLMVIGGFAIRLARQIQEPKCKEYAEIIVQETKKSEFALNELLKVINGTQTGDIKLPLGKKPF